MRSELIRRYNPDNTGRRRDTRVQKLLGDVLGLYYYGFHRLTVKFHPDLPKHGPALGLMGHLSLLDGAAIPADPYRLRSIPVVKQEMADAPVIGWALKKWGAIPAMRDDRDTEAVRKILTAFKSARVLCIAPAGTRSRSGRLDPLQPTAVKLALRASREMPVFPMAVVNAYEALPPGARFPKPKKLFLLSGPLINLDPYNSKKTSPEQIEGAAEEIQRCIARLYPRHNRPLPETPALARLAIIHYSSPSSPHP